jgi:purine-binding chemotaxis protein CheW
MIDLGVNGVSSDNQDALQRDYAALQKLLSQSQSPYVAALQKQLLQSHFGPLGLEVEGQPEATPRLQGEQYLIFSLANRELAVKAELVQGVERLAEITPVPNVLPWVKGVMNLRSSIASVVDLRAFLDLEASAYTARTRLLSLQYNDMLICFVVDSVSEMLPIPATAIISSNTRQANIPPWAAPYASGGALLANRAVVLLDVAQLLFSEKMQRYEALS